MSALGAGTIWLSMTGSYSLQLPEMAIHQPYFCEWSAAGIVSGLKNATLVVGPNAPRFRKTDSDRNVLSVSSVGGAIELVNKTRFGGGVFEVDLTSWICS